MKCTPIKRGSKQMKRSGFKVKTAPPLKKSTTGTLGGNKRKVKSPLKRLKEQLWKLCREIQIKRYGSNCYTCPAKDLSGSSRHLGHFISSSICSTELRYSLDNLRVQCYSCNIHKSGNWLAYERHLIADGIDVQELKDRNEKTKGKQYDVLWYCGKIEEYEKLLSEEQRKNT